MKQLIFLLLVSASCYGQSDSSKLALWKIIKPSSGYVLYNTPKYPPIDTVACHFLEVVNDSLFQWKSGFVIRNDGYIDYNPNVKAKPPYIVNITAQISSTLFYNDMKPVKNYAIQIVLKPSPTK